MKKLLLLLIVLSVLTNCSEGKTIPEKSTSHKENVTQFTNALRAHLDAVTQKDTIAMEKTMAPNGELYFLQPQRELSKTSSSFMDFHKGWFKNATSPWSISFKIIDTEVSDSLGVAIVECVYQEPERDGQPYYNRLHVTYAQKKMNDIWYVILDQATSIEKSTD